MPQTASSIMPIRALADRASPVLSELLPGDTFEVLELADDVAWGIGTTDGVVGYVDARGLDEFSAPTHRIVSIAAPLREAPNANASVLATLPAGARIAALAQRDTFLLTDHGYVATDDVAAIDLRIGNLGMMAGKLAGVPARCGGRSGAGVDAAGMVFLVHDLCGLVAPRFGDLQSVELGAAHGDNVSPRAGDLWFFADHAAILMSGEKALHVADRVTEVSCTALLAGDFGPIVARRRLA